MDRYQLMFTLRLLSYQKDVIYFLIHTHIHVLEKSETIQIKMLRVIISE